MQMKLKKGWFTLILLDNDSIGWQRLRGLLLYNCESHLKANIHP